MRKGWRIVAVLSLPPLLSGGHLVVLAAFKPDDPRYCAILSPPGAAVNARVPYVVTLWPVICPLSRYRYAETKLAETEADSLEFGRGNL